MGDAKKMRKIQKKMVSQPGSWWRAVKALPLLMFPNNKDA